MAKVIVVAVIAVVMSMMTGCRSVTVQTGNAESQNKSADQNSQKDTQKEINEASETEQEKNVLYAASLPAQYFITYETTSENGIVSSISKAVDENGTIYYCSGDEEYLFMKDGLKYTLYESENGTFKANETKQYEIQYIDNLTKDFDEEYVKKANLKTASANYKGEKEICGRTCMIYEIVIEIVNFQQRYEFAIDADTYACLQWKSEKHISGYEESGTENFFCTRFQMEHVNLETEFIVQKR